jgi:hypothetical protein
MPTIMADHDVEGHVDVLLGIWLSAEWQQFWNDAGCDVATFRSLGLASSAPDAEVWRLCQARGILLITGNRNAEGDDSLEATICREQTPQSLPVFTISDPDRLMRDRSYAESVASRLLEYLPLAERVRGSGRLYVP